MAVHLSIGRIRFVPLAVPLAVSLAALVGLAVVAGAVYLPIHPGPEVAPASAVADSVSDTGKAPAEGETETALIGEVALSVRPEKAPEIARIATAGTVDASPADARPADAGSAVGAGENRAGPAGLRAVASQPLDRSHGIDKVEQIHAVDGIADGDSTQPRSALAGATIPETGPERESRLDSGRGSGGRYGRAAAPSSLAPDGRRDCG